MKERLWLRVVCSLVFLLPLSAAGQAPACGNVKAGEELKNPPEIQASGGKLSTWFDVRFQTFCVPEKDNGDGTFTTTPLKLRTYTSPARRVLPEDTPRPATDLTGPTLRLSKFRPPSKPGDALEVLLKNSLPFPASNACSSVCDATVPACDCSPGALGALITKCTTQKKPDCCCVINCTQKAPNCLHGDNVTNLHFHGTHASPQAPQDFVLLDLYPPKPATAPAMDHAEGSHGTYSQVAYGQFQYAVQPFGNQQAEGTHWYHPHKHGSVGTQVANGMAGALLIEGELDDWLKQYYATEKVMVVQSVTTSEKLFKRAVPGAQILVNGQIKPTIKGAPGEIQRWRIVNATMASQNLLELTLPSGLTFRQIAMDGVRFSPVNYECQPLLNFDVNNPVFNCNPTPSGNPTLTIAPGNRVDFLVQLPLTETRKGTEGLRVERELVDIAGDEGDSNRKLLLDRDEAMAPGPAEPPLFTIVVDDGIEGNDDEPKVLKAGAPTMPTTWPPMPAYLSIIEKVDGAPVAMTFQQFLADSQTQQWPYSASPLSSFKIDGRQFCPTCANVTTLLNTAAEWTVSNATQLPHPFHIHTNPFQVWSVKGVPVRPQGKTKPEPFWMDTLMIPTATVNPASAPADPATKITITPASYVFRQRYLDFTGEYVLHCHFLGHEDRGMMYAVQTVCNGPSINPDSKGKYGRPTTDPNGECIFPPFPNPVQPCKKDDPNFCPQEGAN